MFKLVVLLSAISCVLGAAVPEGMVPQLDGRIVGGVATTISNFPWQISILRSGSHSCGGSIYSENIIVTAAHCLQKITAPQLKVRAGSTYWLVGGTAVPVAAFVNHPGYNSRTMINDIALILLSRPLTFSPSIRSIELAEEAPANGSPAAVSGWGVLVSDGSTPSQLRYIDTKILSRSTCASSAYGYGRQIKASMICAMEGGKDSCQGDSGGPLVSDGTLVGVVSFGYGCAEPAYPGVYADVAYFRDWVIETAESMQSYL